MTDLRNMTFKDETIPDSTVSNPEFNQVVVSTSRPLPVSDSRWQTEIGNVQGQSLIDVAGMNDVVGESFVDLSDVGGTQSLPVEGAAEEWEIVSTSPDDKVGGPGTGKVLVGRLIDGWVGAPDVIATVTGTTPNLIPGGAINFRPKQALILTPDGGKNVGDIIIRVAGGGAERLKIKVGEGVTKSSLVSIEVGFTGFAQHILLNVGKGGDADIRSQIQSNGGPIIVGGGIQIYQALAPVNIVAPFTLPEKTDLRLEAISENTGTKVTVFTDFLIVDNKSIINPVTVARAMI